MKNLKKMKKQSNLTNSQSKVAFGRSNRFRLPEECVFNYFELTKRLDFEDDGDTLAWLMDKAVPPSGKLKLENCGKLRAPINKNTNEDLHSDASQLWKNIQVSQLWALWDDDTDGMPRLYARIRQLLFHEMKVEVAFLEPVPTTDQEVKWLVNKPMACGAFKQATSTASMEILDFSHQVICGKGSSVADSTYTISPQKGEIWALYKDWDVNWTLHDFSHCRFELVEVVSDLWGGNVISAMCLTRLEGGDGDTFRRQVHGILQFSESQLLQFSHRILALKLEVQEMDGVSVESWNLNSDTLPIHYSSGVDDENDASIKGEDKKGQFRWNTIMDEILLDFLGDAAREGRRLGKKWDTSVWNELIGILSEKSCENVKSSHIENRLRQMRSEYLNFTELKKKSGVAYDHIKQTVSAPDGFWKELLLNSKNQEKFKAFRERGPKWDYEKLSIVMGDSHATGSYSLSGLDKVDNDAADKDKDDFPSMDEDVDLDDESMSSASTKKLHSKRQHGKWVRTVDDGRQLREALMCVQGLSQKNKKDAFKLLMKSPNEAEIFVLSDEEARKAILDDMGIGV